MIAKKVCAPKNRAPIVQATICMAKLLSAAHLVKQPLVIRDFELFDIRSIPSCQTGGSALEETRSFYYIRVTKAYAATALVSLVLLIFRFHLQRCVVAMLSLPLTTL